MDKLIFSSILKKNLTSATVQIVLINDVRNELSPACNFNISSLKTHVQKIVNIL